MSKDKQFHIMQNVMLHIFCHHVDMIWKYTAWLRGLHSHDSYLIGSFNISILYLTLFWSPGFLWRVPRCRWTCYCGLNLMLKIRSAIVYCRILTSNYVLFWTSKYWNTWDLYIYHKIDTLFTFPSLKFTCRSKQRMCYFSKVVLN